MILLFFTPKQFRFDPEKVDLDTNFDSRYDREPIPKDLGYFFRRTSPNETETETETELAEWNQLQKVGINNQPDESKVFAFVGFCFGQL